MFILRLTVDEVVVLICCAWFSPNVPLCIMGQRLHFGFVCLKDVLPEVLWLVQMQLCWPKQCCYVLFCFLNCI